MVMARLMPRAASVLLQNGATLVCLAQALPATAAALLALIEVPR